MSSKPEAESIDTPKAFTLRAPIQVNGEQITEITLCEPIVSDIEKLVRDEAKDGAVGAMVKLIAKQAKLPPVDLRNLGARDFNDMQEYLGSFLSPKKPDSES